MTRYARAGLRPTPRGPTVNQGEGREQEDSASGGFYSTGFGGGEQQQVASGSPIPSTATASDARTGGLAFDPSRPDFALPDIGQSWFNAGTGGGTATSAAVSATGTGAPANGGYVAQVANAPVGYSQPATTMSIGNVESTRTTATGIATPSQASVNNPSVVTTLQTASHGYGGMPSLIKNAVKMIPPFYSEKSSVEKARTFWNSFKRATVDLVESLRLSAFRECLKGKIGEAWWMYSKINNFETLKNRFYNQFICQTPLQLLEQLKNAKRSRGMSAEVWGDLIKGLCDDAHCYDPQLRYQYFLAGMRNREWKAALSTSLMNTIDHAVNVLLYKNMHLPVENDADFADETTTKSPNENTVMMQMMQLLQQNQNLILQQQQEMARGPRSPRRAGFAAAAYEGHKKPPGGDQVSEETADYEPSSGECVNENCTLEVQAGEIILGQVPTEDSKEEGVAAVPNSEAPVEREKLEETVLLEQKDSSGTVNVCTGWNCRYLASRPIKKVTVNLAEIPGVRDQSLVIGASACVENLSVCVSKADESAEPANHHPHHAGESTSNMGTLLEDAGSIGALNTLSEDATSEDGSPPPHARLFNAEELDALESCAPSDIAEENEEYDKELEERLLPLDEVELRRRMAENAKKQKELTLDEMSGILNLSVDTLGRTRESSPGELSTPEYWSDWYRRTLAVSEEAKRANRDFREKRPNESDAPRIHAVEPSHSNGIYVGGGDEGLLTLELRSQGRKSTTHSDESIVAGNICVSFAEVCGEENPEIDKVLEAAGALGDLVLGTIVAAVLKNYEREAPMIRSKRLERRLLFELWGAMNAPTKRGRRLHLPAELVVDTGGIASLVDSRVLTRLGVSTATLRPYSGSLDGVARQKLRIKGEVDLPLRLGSLEKLRSFVVIDRLHVDAILGTDTLKAFRAVIDLDDNVMTLNDSGEVFPLRTPRVEEMYTSRIANTVRIRPAGQALVVADVIGQATYLSTVLIEYLQYGYGRVGGQERTALAIATIVPKSPFEETLLGENTGSDSKDSNSSVPSGVRAWIDSVMSAVASESTPPRDPMPGLQKAYKTEMEVDFSDSKLNDEQKVNPPPSNNDLTESHAEGEVMESEIRQYLELGMVRYSEKGTTVAIPFRTEHEGSAKVTDVRLARRTQLTRSSVTPISVAVVAPDGESGVFLPKQQCGVVMLAAAVTTVRNGHVLVPAINVYGGRVKLPARKELGTWIPLDAEMELLAMHGAMDRTKLSEWLDTLGDSETPLENEDEAQIEHEEPKVRKLMLRLLRAYREVSVNKGDCPPMTTLDVEHHIDTETAAPILQKRRRHAQAEDAIIESNVTQMFQAGVIQESNGAWGFPVVLVKKKDGEVRFCVDYRALNKVTKKDAYPLPRINETLGALGGAQLFTTLDLRSGYWQIGVAPADRDKTVFTTKQGLNRFRRMPFGLMNAPSTFQRMMNGALRGLTWLTCLVYLDDIVVYTKGSIERHILELATVLERLRMVGLTLKLKSVSLQPAPLDGTSLRHPTSATPPQRVSNRIDGELARRCLAVVWSVTLFRPYLYGRSFTIVMDHAALKWLMTRPNLAGRLHRWSLTLQEYEFVIEYRPGETNVVVDALSRAPAAVRMAVGKTVSHERTAVNVVRAVTATEQEGKTQDDDPADANNVAAAVDEQESVINRPFTRGATKRLEAAAAAARRDATETVTAAMRATPPDEQPVTSRVSEVTRTNTCERETGADVRPASRQHWRDAQPGERRVTWRRPVVNCTAEVEVRTDAHPSRSAKTTTNADGVRATRRAKQRTDATTTGAQQELTPTQQRTTKATGRHDATVPPDVVRTKEARMMMCDDNGESTPVHESTLQLTDAKITAAQERSKLVKKILAAGEFQGKAVKRMYGLVVIETKHGRRVLLPPVLWPIVFEEMHGSVWAGHLRGPHTYGRVAQLYWWPNLQREVNRWVRGCLEGDGAPELTGKSIDKLVTMLQARQINPVPYRPQMIGLVERFHRTWKDCVSPFMAQEAQNDWDLWVKFAVYAFNSAQHSTVVLTPNVLMMGRKWRPPNELLQRTEVMEAGYLPEYHANVLKAMERCHECAERARQKEQARQAKYYDRNVRRRMEPAGYQNYLLEREDQSGEKETIIAHASFLVSFHCPAPALERADIDIEAELADEDLGQESQHEQAPAASERATKAAGHQRERSRQNEKRPRTAVGVTKARHDTSKHMVEVRRRRRRNRAGQYVLKYELVDLDNGRANGTSGERLWVSIKQYERLVDDSRVVEDPSGEESV
ncbi:unnamed protein product [Phytophthora fragariaefolia]|uniref:RNA-directed DNA polymerase n=1 Tax=Phytophthora fragariaefolia TaxID=1490495 RepID=A0A9W6WXU9_9STRA|nr:unnamed protein product [Phytophthora fragariaefolia]